jgi:hypothetical protein
VLLDISLRNVGPDPIHGPLFLKVESAISDFGKIELANPLVVLGANYVDLSTTLHEGSLAPNEKSSAYRLAFHLLREDSASLRQFFLLRLKLRFFCRCSLDPGKKAGSEVVEHGGSSS